MSKHPASDEVAAALGAFVGGGTGPTHTELTRAFKRAGYGSVRPYDGSSQDFRDKPNKENRIRDTVEAAVRNPHRCRELIESILVEFRSFGFFTAADNPADEAERSAKVRTLQRAFARIDWELDDEGVLRPAGVGAVGSVEGRPAIEDQLERLRRASDDPALLLGTAKEMLESTAKYVLEVFSVPYGPRMSFDELWHHARERLVLLPEQVDTSKPGGSQVRAMLGAAWTIAKTANEIRNLEGTGHGRTLPTGVTPEMALLVVREACSVAELSLSTLDRMMGR
ncbi:MAG: abortive infection family protein [Acidimicrobiaceae bacterium]|nr:abortive infection family protein [Acidimicrobiaceae bacterium]